MCIDWEERVDFKLFKEGKCQSTHYDCSPASIHKSFIVSVSLCFFQALQPGQIAQPTFTLNISIEAHSLLVSFQNGFPFLKSSGVSFNLYKI